MRQKQLNCASSFPAWMVVSLLGLHRPVIYNLHLVAGYPIGRRGWVPSCVCAKHLRFGTRQSHPRNESLSTSQPRSRRLSGWLFTSCFSVGSQSPLLSSGHASSCRACWYSYSCACHAHLVVAIWPGLSSDVRNIDQCLPDLLAIRRKDFRDLSCHIDAVNW